jgi:hypothetical protein
MKPTRIIYSNILRSKFQEHIGWWEVCNFVFVAFLDDRYAVLSA